MAMPIPATCITTPVGAASWSSGGSTGPVTRGLVEAAVVLIPILGGQTLRARCSNSSVSTRSIAGRAELRCHLAPREAESGGIGQHCLPDDGDTCSLTLQ